MEFKSDIRMDSGSNPFDFHDSTQLTPLSSIELFCVVVVDDDVIKLFVLMLDAADG